MVLQQEKNVLISVIIKKNGLTSNDSMLQEQSSKINILISTSKTILIDNTHSKLITISKTHNIRTKKRNHSNE